MLTEGYRLPETGPHVGTAGTHDQAIVDVLASAMRTRRTTVRLGPSWRPGRVGSRSHSASLPLKVTALALPTDGSALDPFEADLRRTRHGTSTGTGADRARRASRVSKVAPSISAQAT